MLGSTIHYLITSRSITAVLHFEVFAMEHQRCFFSFFFTSGFQSNTTPQSGVTEREGCENEGRHSGLYDFSTGKDSGAHEREANICQISFWRYHMGLVIHGAWGKCHVRTTVSLKSPWEQVHTAVNWKILANVKTAAKKTWPKLHLWRVIK